MKYKAQFTAYYPSNEGIEGGFYDSLGNKLNPNHNTCACPKEIPFHTKLKVLNTNSKYDNQIYECLDRGSAIIKDDNNVYHIDLLMHNKKECLAFGRRNGYFEIIKKSEGNDMKKYLVAIDCGHGMYTDGKQSVKLDKNLYVGTKLVKKKGQIIKENEWNRAVGKYLSEALKRCNVDTYFTADMTGKTDTPLSTRASRANAKNCNILISCHYNAIGNCSSWQSKCKGLLVMRTRDCSTNSIKLGKLVTESLEKDIKYSHSYGLMRDVDMSGFTLAILRQTHMPSILIEYGFMDNREETYVMVDPSYQKKCAEATCKGICKYFSIPYVSDTKQTVKEPKDSSFKIKIVSESLNVRKGPGTNYEKVTAVKKDEQYTIVKTNENKTWGFLKSEVGWISLNSKYIKKL